MVGQPGIVSVVVGVARLVANVLIAPQLVPLTLAVGLAGCSGSDLSRVPSAPSPVPQAAPPSAPIQLLVFRDPASGFSTSDVHEADDEVVRFNTAREIIWVADDRRFAGYAVNGDQIRGPRRDDYFQVRFGRKNGELRAYLGWSDDYCHCPGYPATIVDLEVVGGQLIATATDLVVPGS